MKKPISICKRKRWEKLWRHATTEYKEQFFSSCWKKYAWSTLFQQVRNFIEQGHRKVNLSSQSLCLVYFSQQSPPPKKKKKEGNSRTGQWLKQIWTIHNFQHFTCQTLLKDLRYQAGRRIYFQWKKYTQGYNNPCIYIYTYVKWI